jgi:tetratricopeptide (TPR) repeat protein
LIESPGDAGAAEQSLNRAIDLDPARADAYYRKGVLRARQGDHRSAIEAFTRATTLKPSLIEAHRAFAETAMAQRDWATVVAELDAVLAWQPDDVRARDQRAIAIDARARETQHR